VAPRGGGARSPRRAAAAAVGGNFLACAAAARCARRGARSGRLIYSRIYPRQLLAAVASRAEKRKAMAPSTKRGTAAAAARPRRPVRCARVCASPPLPAAAPRRAAPRGARAAHAVALAAAAAADRAARRWRFLVARAPFYAPTASLFPSRLPPLRR
jgi:hypothetical protein